MTASYPSSVKVFNTHVNVTEIIDAGHPNTIQEEVVAIQTALGADTLTGGSPLTSTAPSPSGTFDATSQTYDSLALRLANIETGIVSDAHTQYATKSTLTTKGDIYVATSSGNITRLGVGTDGQVLTAASGQSTGLTWSSPVTSYVSQTNGTVTTASTSSGVVRNIYVSTSAPTGGNDGDVWLKYV